MGILESMRAIKVIATVLLIATVSLAKYYQPGEKVIEQLLELELKRDAYKYGGTPYLTSEHTETRLNVEPIAAKEEQQEENAFEKFIHNSQKAYDARAAFVAYALKHGYDAEYLTYFAMWFVASFGFIMILRWALNKLALRNEEQKLKAKFDEVVIQQLVGEL